MASSRPAPAERRRMAPDDRREQILAAARRLFAEQPYTSFSTADVAREAGVTRSLVHHYFGGIRAVFVAVAAELGTALSDVRTAGPETPLEERIARNVAAALDVVDANRETWRAAVGHGAARADPDLRPFMLAADEQSVERMLQANRDVVRDTPEARFAIHCFMAFSQEATRGYVSGQASREDVERLLVTAGLGLLQHTIPALPAQSDRGRD